MSFTKKATDAGMYVVSVLVVINLNYNHPEATIWLVYNTIGFLCVVGYFVNSICIKDL